MRLTERIAAWWRQRTDPRSDYHRNLHATGKCSRLGCEFCLGEMVDAYREQVAREESLRRKKVREDIADGVVAGLRLYDLSKRARTS